MSDRLYLGLGAPLGVMFHHFYDERHPKGQGAISAEEFEQVLDFLGRERIVGAKQWLARSQAGTLEKDSLCLTFDDNLRCQFDVALPVLQKYGLTAFWFVYTSVLDGTPAPLEVYRHFRTTCFASFEAFYEAFLQLALASSFGPEIERRLLATEVDQYLPEANCYSPQDRAFRFLRDRVLGPERYHALMRQMLAAYNHSVDSAHLWMGSAELRALASEGHLIGLHSHTHPTNFSALSYQEQLAEYRANQSSLREVLGANPEVAAHPCSSYNADSLQILRELGVRLAFRANRALASASLLESPRVDHADVMEQIRSR